MTTRNLGIQEAIERVLRDATQSLRPDEIANLIVERGLRSEANVKSVAANLSGMVQAGTVVRPERAKYALNRQPGAPVEPEAIRGSEEDAQLTRVSAYGLQWERNKVNWNPGQGRRRAGLLGKNLDAGGEPVDFSEQSGVYILYHRMVPMYVGKTEKDHLFGRLLDHHDGDRRGARWDTFSWFGFREVNEDGSLSERPESFSTDMLITVLETVIIEAFIPPMNDQGGALLGTRYDQVEDPTLVNQRDAEFRQMVARALAPT